MGFDVRLSRGGHNPRGVWAITQMGRDQEESPGLKGKILSAMVDCGGSASIDRIVTETGLQHQQIANALMVLERQGCVQAQS